MGILGWLGFGFETVVPTTLLGTPASPPTLSRFKRLVPDLSVIGIPETGNCVGNPATFLFGNADLSRSGAVII